VIARLFCVVHSCRELRSGFVGSYNQDSRGDPMMMQSTLDNEIRTFLAGRSIPVAGIAEANQLPGIPAAFSPKSIIPDARSVICYSVPIPRGIVHAANQDLSLYWRYCATLYKSLDMSSNALSLFLEGKGYVASPLYACYPLKVVKREYWGMVPLVYWAREAGLGHLAKSGLLAHPEYGTRMIIGGVCTTAALTPTKAKQYNPCPEKCLDCIDRCPVHAIDRSGKVDHNACMRHASVSPPLAAMIRDKAIKEQFSFEAILNTTTVDEHAVYACINCLKVCPLNRQEGT
jgi:epoxyqueuosine reductase QueG